MTVFVNYGIVKILEYMNKNEQKSIIQIKFADNPQSEKAVDWDKIVRNSEKVADIFERNDEDTRKIQSQVCPA